MFLEAFVLFAVVTIIIAFYWYLTVPKNLPPGPVGLPLLGSALDFHDGSKQHLILQQWALRHGPIFKLYIANKLVVVLADYDSIQEAMQRQGDVFAGRPKMHVFVTKENHDLGVVFSEGELWKEQRRFALSTLRDFGVGRPILEPKIKGEVEILIDRLNALGKNGRPFDPQRYVVCAVSNIVNELVFGRRFSYDDEEFARHFLALTKRTSQSGVSFLTPFLLCESLATLLSFTPLVRRFKKETDDFLKFVKQELEKTMAAYGPDADPTNFVHAFMKASAENRGRYFSQTQLAVTAVELFGAGTETTATTIRWAILLLATHQDIQEQLFREIENTIGLSSMPDFADRTKLPFVEATIMETQRFANLIPLGVLHRTLAPAKLMGYDIPEDALVLPLLTNVLHNPDLYPNPHKFDPGRFLDDEGKCIKDQRLIPFGLGKRICLGESLARMELFLFLTGLLSRFRFYIPEDQPKPTLKPCVGITCTPAYYQICIERRPSE